MEANEINTDELKYDILDALRDIRYMCSDDEYLNYVKSLVEKLRKCKILIEVK